MSKEEAAVESDNDLQDVDKANLSLFSFSDADLEQREITPVEIGSVVVQSGQVRVSDPLAYLDFPALKRRVPPGRYPARIYFALGRVAAASMRLMDGIPVSWELAGVEDDVDGQAQYAGLCPVDAGMAGFMDVDAFAQMKRRVAKLRAERSDKSVNYYNDVIATEVAVNDEEWTLHQPMSDSDLNVAIFHSGWGDGVYPVLWGLSADGEAMVLFVDFTVMEDADGRKEPE